MSSFDVVAREANGVGFGNAFMKKGRNDHAADDTKYKFTRCKDIFR